MSTPRTISPSDCSQFITNSCKECLCVDFQVSSNRHQWREPYISDDEQACWECKHKALSHRWDRGEVDFPTDTMFVGDGAESDPYERPIHSSPLRDLHARRTKSLKGAASPSVEGECDDDGEREATPRSSRPSGYKSGNTKTVRDGTYVADSPALRPTVAERRKAVSWGGAIESGHKRSPSIRGKASLKSASGQIESTRQEGSSTMPGNAPPPLQEGPSCIPTEPKVPTGKLTLTTIMEYLVLKNQYDSWEKRNSDAKLHMALSLIHEDLACVKEKLGSVFDDDFASAAVSGTATPCDDAQRDFSKYAIRQKTREGAPSPSRGRSMAVPSINPAEIAVTRAAEQRRMVTKEEIGNSCGSDSTETDEETHQLPERVPSTNPPGITATGAAEKPRMVIREEIDENYDSCDSGSKEIDDETCPLPETAPSTNPTGMAAPGAAEQPRMVIREEINENYDSCDSGSTEIDDETCRLPETAPSTNRTGITETGAVKQPRMVIREEINENYDSCGSGSTEIDDETYELPKRHQKAHVTAGSERPGSAPGSQNNFKSPEKTRGHRRPTDRKGYVPSLESLGPSLNDDCDDVCELSARRSSRDNGKSKTSGIDAAEYANSRHQQTQGVGEEEDGSSSPFNILTDEEGPSTPAIRMHSGILPPPLSTIAEESSAKPFTVYRDPIVMKNPLEIPPLAPLTRHQDGLPGGNSNQPSDKPPPVQFSEPEDAHSLETYSDLCDEEMDEQESTTSEYMDQTPPRKSTKNKQSAYSATDIAPEALRRSPRKIPKDTSHPRKRAREADEQEIKTPRKRAKAKVTPASKPPATKKTKAPKSAKAMGRKKAKTSRTPSKRVDISDCDDDHYSELSTEVDEPEMLQVPTRRARVTPKIASKAPRTAKGKSTAKRQAKSTGVKSKKGAERNPNEQTGELGELEIGELDELNLM